MTSLHQCEELKLHKLNESWCQRSAATCSFVSSLCATTEPFSETGTRCAWHKHTRRILICQWLCFSVADCWQMHPQAVIVCLSHSSPSSPFIFPQNFNCRNLSVGPCYLSYPIIFSRPFIATARTLSAIYGHYLTKVRKQGGKSGRKASSFIRVPTECDSSNFTNEWQRMPECCFSLYLT